jgi:hypothetical protein
MYILYITKSWLLHSQYFTTFFINIIVLPGVIVLLYESFRKKYFIYSLFFIFLLIAPFFKANPVFVQQNTVKVQSWRESLLRELLPIKNELRNKVIFIDPGNFLNRYISTDFNVYLYAVNTNSQYGFTSRPFTTLPANELSKFSQFFHVSERMSLADNFLSSPNEYSYLDLLKYRVDYFIILNNPVPKYDLSKVKFFFEEELQNPPFFTTKNYTVYRNN